MSKKEITTKIPKGVMRGDKGRLTPKWRPQAFERHDTSGKIQGKKKISSSVTSTFWAFLPALNTAMASLCSH